MSVEPNWTGYSDPRYPIVQRPIAAGLDLRDMLRQHILVRALAHMRAAEERRQQALAGGDVRGYRASIRRAVRALSPESSDGAALSACRGAGLGVLAVSVMAGLRVCADNKGRGAGPGLELWLGDRDS